MSGSAILELLPRIVEIRILLVRKVEKVVRHDDLPYEPLQLLCGRHCQNGQTAGVISRSNCSLIAICYFGRNFKEARPVLILNHVLTCCLSRAVPRESFG